MPSVISGVGILTQNGSNVLTLTASNDFSGTAVVNNGTLLVNGVLSGSLTNAAGTTLGGSGTNSGPVTVSGLIQPSAASGTPAAFTSGALTLSSGATLTFDVSGADTTAGNGVNDLLAVGGGLDVNNNTVALNFQGVPQAGSTYTLVNFSGTQNGSLNSTVAGTHLGATLNQGVSPVTVALGGSGANLKWGSTASAVWDVGSTSNWLNSASSLQDVFYAGDNVRFDDSVSGVVTNVAIASGVSVSPTTITNNSSTHNYTIGGPGRISGNVSIVKQGSSTLTLSGANPNFTGTATVQGGTLRVGNNGAFGASGTVVVTNGGTVDLNGAGIGEVPVIVAGAGVGGNGAIINSGADQIHAVNIAKLSGDAVFGGTGRWDIRINGADTTLLTTSDSISHNLTKTGPNLVALVTCAIDQSIGDIDVQGGNFGLQLTGTAQNSPGFFNDTTHTISVENNALLEFDTLGSAYPMYRTIALNNGSTLLSDAGDNAIGGSVILTGNDTIGVTAGSSPWLQISGVISGSGNLIKTGALPLT